MTVGDPQGSARPGNGHSADGLDDQVWQILRVAVIAAGRGDVPATHMATRRFDTDVPVDGRASTYIWWLLRYRVAQLVGRRPTAEDLQEIAARQLDKFGVLITDISVLEDVLLTVWHLAPPEREVKAGRFVVAGVAALGVLLDDPVADLEAVRLDLAAWWQKNLAKFRAQGILDDRSHVARPGR
jgi:hypothetical protein